MISEAAARSDVPFTVIEGLRSKERQAQFAKWREQAEAIEAEFTHVNS